MAPMNDRNPARRNHGSERAKLPKHEKASRKAAKSKARRTRWMNEVWDGGF